MYKKKKKKGGICDHKRSSFLIWPSSLSQHFFLPRFSPLPPPLWPDSLVSWYATERHNYPLHLSRGANGGDWSLGEVWGGWVVDWGGGVDGE